MTITQLEYIVAVAREGSFVKAANKCHVTQPTLSMQIQKLEDELNTILFDRKKQPVVPTDLGITVIEKAEEVLKSASTIYQMVKDARNEVSGSLKLGVIPTLAPYLLPLWVGSFMEKYPLIDLEIQEHTTEDLVRRLRDGSLDAAIAATPLNDKGISEEEIFLEPFVVYASPTHPLYKLPEVSIADITNRQGLWLLNEGHCFREQTLKLCDPKSMNACTFPLKYQSGSLETLVRIIDHQGGFTFLPYLAILDMAEERKKNVRFFNIGQPVRQISLLSHRSVVKRKLLDRLKESVKSKLPLAMNTAGGEMLVSWR